jgi:hypothetical protein
MLKGATSVRKSYPRVPKGRGLRPFNGQVKLSQADALGQGEPKSILPHKPGLFKIAQFGPTFSGGPTPSFLPNNQVDHDRHHSDFAIPELCQNTKCYIGGPNASAHTPDVPRQLIDSIKLAGTVRECVRDWESGEHAD